MEHARERAARGVLRRAAVRLVDDVEDGSDEVRADSLRAGEHDAMDARPEERDALRERADHVHARVRHHGIGILEPTRERGHNAGEVREEKLA